MSPLKTIVSRVETWPVGLCSAEVIAQDTGLSVERISQMADAGCWPHYRVDGGAPMFRKTESRDWAAKHLLQRFEGQEPRPEFKVVLAATETVQSMPPLALRALRGLTELTQYLQPPGIYFLCHGDDVVYIGQSVRPLNRIEQHRSDKAKTFDRVYFVPVPVFLLNAVEREFIGQLKPRLNGNLGPPQDKKHAQLAKEMVAQVGQVSAEPVRKLSRVRVVVPPVQDPQVSVPAEAS